MLTRRIVASGLPSLVVAKAWGAEDTTRIDLTRTPPGQLPSGFVAARTGSGAPPEWSVVADATSASGRALVQTSTDRTDYRFPLAIYQGVTAADVEVAVRFKAAAGDVDRAAGIAVRLSDADNYYVVRANALEDNVNFYRVVKGVRREVTGVNTRVAAGVWHGLGLRVIGASFTVSFNGKDLFAAKDGTFAKPGKIALWTKADSVTFFDTIEIRPLP